MILANSLVAVCKADKLVALHFATAQGIVVVRLPLTSFLAKTRLPIDSNGVPLTQPLSTLAQAEADAEQVPITKGSPDRVNVEHTALPKSHGPVPLAPVLVEALRSHFDQGKTAAHAARYTGTAYETARRYFVAFRQAAATERQPIAKPSGKLL